MKKFFANDTFDQSELAALAGPNSREFVKKMFDEASKPDLHALLYRLRQACAKRAGTLKTVGFMDDDERQWTAGVLQELEETVARVKALLAASPSLATDAERRKAIGRHLRLKAKFRQIQSGN